MKICAAIYVSVLLLCYNSIIAEELVYRLPTGEFAVISIEDATPFTEVLEEIRQNKETKNTFPPSNEYLLDFMATSTHYSMMPHSKAPLRNYKATLSAKEKKEIAYIVETLGNSSLVKIAKAKSSLEKSGKVIDNVHPLKFLSHVFSTEKLKAATHNIYGRSWVWSTFCKGIIGSLEEENNRDNLLPFIADFSSTVQINSEEIYPIAKRKQWKDFIEALFTKIPRSETSGRYDM